MPDLVEKPFPWKCGHCRERAVYRTSVPYTTEIQHDGQLHHITVTDLRVPRCQSCGEMAFDSLANKQLYDALRQQQHLLRPEEIRQHREALNLSQRELAAVCRVEEVVLKRWESGGQIQSGGQDTLLRNAFGLDNIRTAVTRQNGPRNGALADRVIARLVESIESPEVREAVEQALADRPRLAEDLESGKADWERLLRHLLPWVLALSPPEQRGWIQFFKKDLGSDDERPLTTLLEIRSKADGDFAADLTQYIRQLVDLSRGKRKDAMRISKDVVEALSKG